MTHLTETPEVLSDIRSNVVSSLLNLLNSGDEVDKCNASRALGSIGATEAIDDLLNNIKDDDIDVCIDAVAALGQLRATQVIPQLIESLKNDPDGELKTSIVRSLGNIKHPDTIPMLIEIAENKPKGIIIDSNDDWDDWWDMQQQAIIALGKMKADGATEMLNRLLHSDDILDIENEILNALVNIGTEGENIVIEHLTNKSELTRRRAVKALALSQSKESLKALSSAFKDASDDVRSAAIQSVVKRKSVKFLKLMELLQKDPSEKIRQEAIVAYHALNKISLEAQTNSDDSDVESSTKQTSANVQLLNDKDAQVRATYLESLQSHTSQISNDELEQHIETAFNDKEDKVLLAAIPLLAQLEDTEKAETRLLQLISRPKLAETLFVKCLRTLASLKRWNINISRMMSRLINHNTQLIRLTALETLMTLENNLPESDIDEKQKKSPIEIINDTLSGRMVLEVEVASFNTKSEPKDIEETSNDDNQNEIEEVEATSTLASILQDNERIEKALQESNQEPEDAIEHDPLLDEFHSLVQDNVDKGEWLFNQKEEVSVALNVQRTAAKILSKLPLNLSNEKAKTIVSSLLLALNSNDEKLRTYAAQSIAQIATDNPETAGVEYAFGGLVTQFQHDQWDLKLACIRALGAIRNRAAIPIIAQALEHKRAAIRIQAIQSTTELQLNGLAILKNAHIPEEPPTLTEWVRTLMTFLQDKESGVRYSAVNQLKRCLEHEEISQQKELISDAIESIVQAAFNNNGGRTRDMAHVLKAIEPIQGTQRLIELLKELPSSYERRFAIEMLEEMYLNPNYLVAA